MSYKIKLVLFFSLFFHASLFSYSYELSIFAIFQNEGPYLQEWIEFHKLLGVEHFYLYNNNSQDDYLDKLAPYINNGEVELIQWPFESENERSWVPIHCKAYEDAIERSKFQTKWLIGIDLDEFIFPLDEPDLISFLKDYEQFGTICVNWQTYGTSNMDCIPDNCTMIETLLYRAPTYYPMNFYVKSIVKPELVVSCSNSHYVNLLPGYVNINPDKNRFRGAKSPYLCLDKIRINHYWSRDNYYLHHVKIPRQKKWGKKSEVIFKQVEDMNQVKDTTILKFVPQLRLKLGYKEITP